MKILSFGPFFGRAAPVAPPVFPAFAPVPPPPPLSPLVHAAIVNKHTLASNTKSLRLCMNPSSFFLLPRGSRKN
jgi:hypothetical protein